MVDLVKMLSHRKGDQSAYRPEAGTICLISGPHCDDENGYTFGEFEVLWSDALFVLYRKEGCWPVLNKWEHIIAKPAASPVPASEAASVDKVASKQLFDALEEVRVILQKGTVTIDKIHELGADGPAEEAWQVFHDEVMPLYRAENPCPYCKSFGPHDMAYPHPRKNYSVTISTGKVGGKSLYEIQRDAAEQAVCADLERLGLIDPSTLAAPAAPTDKKENLINKPVDFRPAPKQEGASDGKG